MNYKHFPAPFFNHFIHSSPPTIAKLKSLHGVLKGQLYPLKWSHPLWFTPPAPSFDNFKIPPPSNLFALPSPINMTTVIRQNKVSPYC